MTTRAAAWTLAALATTILWACGGGGTDDTGTDPGRDVPADVPPDLPPDAPDVAPDPGDVPPADLPDAPVDAPDVADATDPGPATVTLARGAYTLVVDRDARSLALKDGDRTLLAFQADGLQLGRVDGLDEFVSYDPYPLAAALDAYSPPDGLAWLDVTALRITGHDDTNAEIALSYGTAKEAVLVIQAPVEGRFSLKLTPAAAGDDIAFVRLRPVVDAQEAFYGLGAWLDRPEHRGTIRAMQLEADDYLEGRYNEAHVGIPFVIGTNGWGLFVADRHPAVFDVAKASDDHVEATFGTAFDTAKGIEFHLFAAPRPLDVTRHYYDVTGAPNLPARWALGPWIWRDEIDGQAKVQEDLEAIRDLDLATTGYWIDRPYASGVNAFDFHPDHYADPEAMIGRAHALGLRMALWHTPYLSEGNESSDATKALAQEARDKGYFPPTVGLRLNGWSDPVDLSNPDAFDWWQGLIRRYTDLGIEGFKLDYGEDIVPGLLGIRSVWKFADGSDERTMHSNWRLLYHSAYAQTLPADGGFLLCRAGSWGDQVNVSVIWPGDLDANFAKHNEPIPGDSKGYTYVGGLPASIVYGVSLGPSGFPFFGADSGGYRHSPPDNETFMRWYQQTALSSVMQVGTSTNNVAWEFKQPNGDPDTVLLDNYREYARLHLRLFPYEWTHAQRIAATGHPIQQPLGLAYPVLARHPADAYLFGDDLLVAPVVEAGARSRVVPVPPGRWRHWFTGQVLDGDLDGSEAEVSAPLTELPLFQREGSLIPMLRPTIDAIAPTLEPDRVDSYATTPGVLWTRVWPGGPGANFDLFDGSTVGQQWAGDTLVLAANSGLEFQSGAVFEVVGLPGKPLSAKVDEVDVAEAADRAALLAEGASGWWWDAASGTLWARVPGGEHTVRATLPPAR